MLLYYQDGSYNNNTTTINNDNNNNNTRTTTICDNNDNNNNSISAKMKIEILTITRNIENYHQLVIYPTEHHYLINLSDYQIILKTIEQLFTNQFNNIWIPILKINNKSLSFIFEQLQKVYILTKHLKLFYLYNMINNIFVIKLVWKIFKRQCLYMMIKLLQSDNIQV